MNRKAPTPIRSAPSSAPLETMVTKQQAHIDELVSKNRATEQAIQKLKSEIDHERHRHENTLQQFVQEREEWKGAADSLQGLWRIAYLRGVTELEAERMNVFKMKEELRRMRMARLQRDYQIGMFQAKELETENRIVDLQERIQDAEWMYEEEHSQRIHLKEQLQEDAEGLQEIRDERDQLEVGSAPYYSADILK
ncbi:hypothetical protein BDW22DRAFT_158477 [Trametopsis cervina]|nr:hypothetical protein BDW22DRAFT_158477 [Trametopsis cervina]